MRHFIFVACALCAFSWSAWAASAPAEKPRFGIAAQVGEEAISSYDVENRIKFIIATSGLAGTPDVIANIRPQVIRSLVDEKLQLQEGAKNDITVTPQDIEQAITMIEQQRGMPPGTIKGMLQSNNIPQDTFTSQIKAQLSWNRLLMKKVRPTINANDDEIEQMRSKNPLKKAAENAAAAAAVAAQAQVPQEYKIAVVVLPVDKPSAEKQMKALGDKLVGQMRAGASFEEVSRQFSPPTANAGGKVESFWVRLNQVDPRVARVLQGATKGTITPAVRTAESYTIVKVYQTRDLPGAKPPKPKPAPAPKPEAKTVLIKAKEYWLKAKEGETRDTKAMVEAAAELTKNPGSCDDGKVPLIKSLEAFDVLSRLYQDTLPQSAKPVVEALAIGGVSAPIEAEDGVRVYVRCDPKDAGDKAAERDQLYSLVLQEKMELEAQKYMRNLRRQTFIDVR